MDELYKKITNKVLESGKRIRERSGNIEDIGILKPYLTEEDIRIERELKEVVKAFDPSHEYYAEEEHDDFLHAENVWVVDPISGTQMFISGLPHYGIVAAHIHNREVQFAVVYDPSMDNLYTAERGKGAYLNGKRISVQQASTANPKVLFNLSVGWEDTGRKMFKELVEFDLYRMCISHAVNDSLIASGKFNGVVTMGKDSFPYFATSLLIQEAGGIFTNIDGEEHIKASDRVFIGGDPETYQKLKAVVDGLLR